MAGSLPWIRSWETLWDFPVRWLRHWRRLITCIGGTIQVGLLDCIILHITLHTITWYVQLFVYWKHLSTRSYFILKIRCISPIRLIETESETQSINPYAFCVHISIIVCKYDWVYVCSACVHQGTWHSAFQESLTLRALNKPTGLCDLDQRDDDWIDTKSTLESDDASVE